MLGQARVTQGIQCELMRALRGVTNECTDSALDPHQTFVAADIDHDDVARDAADRGADRVHEHLECLKELFESHPPGLAVADRSANRVSRCFLPWLSAIHALIAR